MLFRNVVAKWPGNTHDSFILSSSSISEQFENGEFGKSWLLGDSGYALKEWLMTPLSNPDNHSERKYNCAHKKTRCLIERAFGILKSRWRILDHTGGRLCYSPDKVAKITMACCILHNICRKNGTPIIGPYPPISALISSEEHSNSSTINGATQRQRLIAIISANC